MLDEMSVVSKFRSKTVSARLGVLAIAFFSVCYLLACQVPVFRYALERWPADPYELRVPAEMMNSTAVSILKESKKSNLRVIELTGDAKQAELFHARQTDPASIPVWKGELTDETAGTLLQSPVRQTLVEKVLSGESVIWVLIPGKNAVANEGIRELLDTTLARAEQVIQIPEGVVTEGDDLATSNFSGDPEDIVSADIPLKIAFSVLELQHDDPAETILLNTLLSIEDDLHDLVDQPMVFPVFGRGRFLEPMIGKGISESNILDYSAYLCGACSCEVKEGNPGMDLLITADWSGADEATVTTLTKAAEPLPETVEIKGPEEENDTMRSLALGVVIALLLIGGLYLFIRKE